MKGRVLHSDTKRGIAKFLELKYFNKIDEDAEKPCSCGSKHERTSPLFDYSYRNMEGYFDGILFPNGSRRERDNYE